MKSPRKQSYILLLTASLLLPRVGAIAADTIVKSKGAVDSTKASPGQAGKDSVKPAAKSGANPATNPTTKNGPTTVVEPESAPAAKPQPTSSAKPAEASQTWTGYLLDRSCAAAIKGENKDAMKSVKEHTKACSLEPSCCEAGYSIYSQGQWLDLDNGSSQQAKKVMQASKRDKAHMVKVVGMIKRGEVRATSITEVN